MSGLCACHARHRHEYRLLQRWKVVPKQYWYQHRHSVCLDPCVSNSLDLLFNRGDLPYFGYSTSSCFEAIIQICYGTSAMLTTFWDPTFRMFYLPMYTFLLCLWMFPRSVLRLLVPECCEVTTRSTKVDYLMYLGYSNTVCVLLRLIVPCCEDVSMLLV